MNGTETAADIELTVPIEPRHAATLRVVAAAVCADGGFSIDEIDDVRLGLNELFSLLVTQHGGARVHTRFQLQDHRLAVTLVADSGDALVRADELATNILCAVLDTYEISPGTIRFEKVAREATGDGS